MSTQEKKRIKAIVEAHGYYVDIDKWPAKLTFYNREGIPLPNMPADPWSMERCLKKGFTLTPPVIKPPIQPSNGNNGSGSDKALAELKEKAKVKRKAKAERKKRKYEREFKTEEKVNA